MTSQRNGRGVTSPARRIIAASLCVLALINVPPDDRPLCSEARTWRGMECGVSGNETAGRKQKKNGEKILAPRDVP